MKRIMVLVIAIINIASIIALANGAEPDYFSERQGILYFKDDSDITLIKENILVVVKEDRPVVADITVDYTLKAKESNKSTEMYFVVPQIGDYKILINNIDMSNSVELAELPKIENWEPTFDVDLIEPVGGQSLNYYESELREMKELPMYGLIIPLDFVDTDIITLEIHYSSYNGLYDEDVKNPVYTMVYFMTPAEFWEGDPQVNYKIVLPNNEYKIASSLEMKNSNSKTYEGELDKLPNYEWVISYASTEGLIFGANSISEHNSMMFILVVILLVISIVLAYLTKKFAVFSVGYVLTNLFWLLFLGSQGHPFISLIVYVFLIVVLWVVVPILIYIGYSSYISKKRLVASA